MRVRYATWLVTLAGVLVACSSTSPDSSASPSLGPSATSSAAASPPPAAGEPAELIFRLASVSDVQPVTPDLSVYLDGRLLVIDEDGLLVQRVLTQGAVQAIVGEIMATGWFGESHSVPLDLMPGVEQPALGPSADLFTVRNPDGALIAVVNGMPHAGPPWWVRSEERDALAQLADRLRSLAWVPEGGWLVEEPSPYRASAYLLFSGVTDAGPDGPCPSGAPITECARDVDSIGWPLPLHPDGFGQPFVPAGEDPGTSWDHCLLIGRGVAEAFGRALEHPGMTTTVLGEGDSIPWVDQNAWLDLWMRQLLPDETLTCDGKEAPPIGFR